MPLSKTDHFWKSTFSLWEIPNHKNKYVQLTVLQFAVVPSQTSVRVSVAPGAVFVPVRVAAVVLVQPYMG